MKLPNRALTDQDLTKYAKLMKIPHFRGVFMRNALPRGGPRVKESSIINLDDWRGPGTHWVCFRKEGNHVSYFDSFGNLQAPPEVVQYLGSGSIIFYNHERYQNYKDFNCGHLCLRFLKGQL